MTLYKKTEYVLAMPAYRDAPDDEGLEYAIQPCDANGKPESFPLNFLSKEDFEKEYAPVRRRNRPTKTKTPARVRNNKTKDKINAVNLNEIE